MKLGTCDLCGTAGMDWHGTDEIGYVPDLPPSTAELAVCAICSRLPTADLWQTALNAQYEEPDTAEDRMDTDLSHERACLSFAPGLRADPDEQARRTVAERWLRAAWARRLREPSYRTTVLP